MTRSSPRAPFTGGAIVPIDQIRRPDLARLYDARIARLTALADGDEGADGEGADYSLFVADLTRHLKALAPTLATGSTQPRKAAQEDGWTVALHALEQALRGTPALNDIADEIAALAPAETTAAGVALAEGRFDAVSPRIAPILWAALSVQVAVSARQAALPDATANADVCPVCGTAPVASHILDGQQQGLRYLHCALCECEWHVVRAICTTCGDTGGVEYLSLETTDAVTKAECCNHCHGYLKVVSSAADALAETVADDLMSLPLDDAVEQEGYHRTGFNPWALPQG